MVALPVNSPILTLRFTDGATVTLQYHPAALSSVERSQSNSQPGIDQTVTFGAPPDTTQTSLRITAYFTALNAPSNVLADDLKPVLAAGTALIAAAGSAGGAQILDVIQAGSQTISLVKGVVDLTRGLIAPSILPTKPTDLGAQWDKLRVLDRALHDATPCSITWDVDNQIHQDEQYLINEMELAVEDIQADTGATTTLRVGLSLIKVGASPIKLT